MNSLTEREGRLENAIAKCEKRACLYRNMEPLGKGACHPAPEGGLSYPPLTTKERGGSGDWGKAANSSSSPCHRGIRLVTDSKKSTLFLKPTEKKGG